MSIKYKLWFVILPISSKIKIEILKTGIDYESIYNLRKEIFKKSMNLEKVLAISLNDDRIYELERGILNNEIFLVTYEEDYYPKILKDLVDAPYNLFYKGDIEKINKMNFIALVGSRKATSYGEIVTRDIVGSLKGQDLGIISGGALGIDSIAHKAAIENNIFNVAVLGCGINVIYPKVNKLLFDQIPKNGVVISEFLPNEQPFSYNFPKRNRIISGISKCVIVCEAGLRSGATNTAFHACNQNKIIYAVPGSIYSENSKGCNSLINDGALIYNNIEQVFANLNFEHKKIKKDKNYSLKLEILRILEEKPTHINEIIRKTSVDSSIINELLFEMQFNNEIVGLTGNNYMKILRNT